VFNSDTAYITQLKRQISKKVLLRRSALTLWRRAATVIAFLMFAVLVVWWRPCRR